MIVCKYTVHLLRYCAQINPQRIEDTPAVYFCSRLVVSERTRMSGVLISSDVFAQQKLASGSVHGCTLPDRLFSKKLMVKGFSEPTRTSVVPYRSEFAYKLVAHECTRMYIRERGIYGVAILVGKFLEKHANIRIFLAKNLQKSYKDLWRYENDKKAI